MPPPKVAFCPKLSSLHGQTSTYIGNHEVPIIDSQSEIRSSTSAYLNGHNYKLNKYTLYRGCAHVHGETHISF
jgi:hypothetical protein